jgi:hypothetical protein
LRPQTKEELFNLRHASLRNVVERTFGVLKHRFPILNTQIIYSLETQADLPHALACLHNFIVRQNGQDDMFFQEEFARDLEEYENREGHWVEEDDGASEWRDEIARQMWENYRQHRQR